MLSGPALSISMVSLNRPDLVEQCLNAIEATTTSVAYEVHVVAHNFEAVALEKLRQRHPSITLHRVEGIRGYSQNNNVALRVARGRYVAILNDDTVVRDDVFGKLTDFLDRNRDIAGVCPVLRNANGSLQMGIRGRFTPLAFIAQQLRVDRLIPIRWAVRLGAFDRPWLQDDERTPVDIEAGTGACFVARRDALEAIGLLDEDYFLGPDDIDWTVRLKRIGRVVLLPDASIVHFGGSTLGGRYRAVLPTVYAGCYTFFRRYHGRMAEWTVRLVVGCAWSFLLSGVWAISSLVSASPRARTMTGARWNCVRFAFSALSSRDVFARLTA
jgi:GT2 family glycosyltransferase